MTKDLTQGSPTRLILQFSFPLMLGFLLQQFYNFVDTAIVGKTLGLDALVHRASHLRSIAFEPPGPAIGTTTAESMQSGVIYGAACLVDGMFRRMAAEMDTSEGAPSLILTGGLAPLVAPYCETKPLLAPDLLLEGLYRCYLRAKGEE